MKPFLSWSYLFLISFFNICYCDITTPFDPATFRYNLNASLEGSIILLNRKKSTFLSD